MADELGTPLMPWQKKGARLLGELRDEWCICHDPPRLLPRYKTVVVSVCRQQGKTVLARVAISTKAESEWDLKMYGTARSRQYAARHVVSLGDFLQQTDPLLTVKRGVGNEVVEWENGSTYLPISPTEGGGHGDSIDFLLVDEGWAVSAVTLGGVVPAMTARPHSQLLAISTMGTVDSEVWNGIVTQGREAVDDSGSDIAYIEYSAPSDEAVFDESQWHTWMPALGITVSYDDIRSAMKLLEAAEGRNEVVRAFGNRTVKTLVTVFPGDYVEKAWRVIDPPDRFVLAVDINDEPAGAAVATGHLGEVDGVVGGAVRIIEARYGTPRWLPSYVEGVLRSREVEAVVGDFGGPAREVKAELTAICEENLVPLIDRVPRDLAADTRRFYDGLREGTVYLNKSEFLAEALAGARRKDFSDTGLWVVSRGRMSVDASPLIAAIMAHGLATELSVSPKVEFFVY
jgi:hypothetical protein